MKRKFTKLMAALALLCVFSLQPMKAWATNGDILNETFETTSPTVENWTLNGVSGHSNGYATFDSGSAYTGSRGLHLGSGSNAFGSATTPTLSGMTENATMTFWAKTNTNNHSLKLSATGCTIDQTSIVIANGTWTQYTVNITNGTSSAVINFYKDGTTKKYIYIDDVVITSVSSSNPTVATPTFDPTTGTYTEAQTVSISCDTEDATIYYTINGNDPTTSSSVYTESLTISETTTVKAMAVADGYENSNIATAVYTIKCATPSFSPVAGTYTEAQTVTISCATVGATIYYTTDGTTPTSESSEYSSPLNISETTTVKAIAVKAGLSNSSVANAEYTINLPYTGADYVRITDLSGLTDGARVIIAARYNTTATSYYAMTAATTGKPTGVGFTSTSSSNGECLPSDILNSENTYYWTVNVTSDGYTFTNASNQVLGYTSSTNFATGGDNTEWTIARATAGNAAMVGGYEGFYIVNKNNTGRGIALNNQHNYGPYSTGNNNSSDYNFYLDIFVQGYTPASVATPTFNPVSGTEFGNDGIDVTITCATENTTIYYTLDGSDPDDESYQYTEAIHLTATTTIKAIAYDGNDNTSSVATATYTYVDPNAPGTQNNPYTVAEARAAIDAGTGTQGVYATGIVSAIPTAWSSQYSNITFNMIDEGGTDFLQAFRCVSTDNADASTVAIGDVVVVSGNLTKFTNNGVTTYEFAQGCQLVSLTHPAVVVEAPTFNPAAGLYTETQSVTISCATADADIYYTTDGTTPTNESTLYENPITVSSTTTIKAIAILGEYNSTVASATYAFLEHAGTETDPYTVADAYAAIDANDGITGVYATGIVSEIVTAYSSQYGNISYNISSDGLTTSDQLQAYRGKSYNGGSFTSEDDIQVGDIVVVYGNLKNYNGTYEFETANELVSLKRSYTLNITGYTDVTEGTNNKGYYLIASPVTVDPATNGMTTGDFDLYYYDQEGDGEGNEWINYRATETTINHFNLVPGKGYLYAKKATTETPSYSFTLTGAPYNGYEIERVMGWNLVGNPYATAASLNMPFYRMNPEGSALVSVTEGNVTAMEGVFIEITEEDLDPETGDMPNVEFTPVNGKSVAALNLNLSQNRGSVIDNAIVRFDNGKTLSKFQFREGSTKLYIPQGNQDFAIVRSANEGEMPVSFKASENGTYTLAVEAENVEMNYLHLIDNLTGMDVDLLQTPSYTFEAKTSDYASRFRLVFKANGTNENNAETFAYFNGTNWTVSNVGDATLQVVDVTGRTVANQMINGNAELNLNQPAGVYVIRLVNGDNVKTQKVVVR